MNDGNIVNDLTVVVELFNVYALMLLFIGGLVLWALNWGISKASQKITEKMPTRRFLILQITTLIGFVLYTVGAIALVIGVLQPPKEFMLAAGGSIAVALGFALKDLSLIHI